MNNTKMVNLALKHTMLRTTGEWASAVIEREGARIRTPLKGEVTREDASIAGPHLHPQGEGEATEQRAEKGQGSKGNSLFTKEQQKNPADLLAPSASVATATTPTSATTSSCGTGSTEHTAERSTESLSTRKAYISAQTGKPKQVAPHQTTTRSTSAQVAEKHLMELRHVLEGRKSKPITPYNVEAWERKLREAGLLEEYGDVPAGLRSGFWAGIPKIHQTFTPPNKASVRHHEEDFQKIMDTEFKSQCYIGPLSKEEAESLLGPFQSSPLHIIPKAGRPGKFRLIQNLSYPHAPQPQRSGEAVASINSQITSDDFPCTWGTFETVSLTISRLPPGSQAAVRDIKEAYRTIPLHPSQWPGMVVRINESDFAIDTQDCFGLGSGAGVFGRVADAGVQLIRDGGMGPVSKWVDDHIFFRIRKIFLSIYNAQRAKWAQEISAEGGRRQDGGRIWFRGKLQPDEQPEEFDEDCKAVLQDLSGKSPRSADDEQFSYSMEDIDKLFTQLGIQVEKEKDILFQVLVPYLGFLWDLEKKTVALQPAKGEKYLSAIREWQEREVHSLEDVQKLYGKLLHASNVIPSGRAYLTKLEAFMASFNNKPHAAHRPPKHTDADLQWWAARLKEAPSRSLTRPAEVRDLQAFSDASTETGIGIIIGNRWRAWRLLPGWKTHQRDIGWAEAVGFLLLIQAIVDLGSEAWARGDCIRVFGDNRGVVEGWWKGRSRNWPTNLIFRKIHEISKSNGLQFCTSYIRSGENPADEPSRGIYGDPQLLLPKISIPSDLTPFVADFDQPISTKPSPESKAQPATKKLKIETHLQAAKIRPVSHPPVPSTGSATPLSSSQLRPSGTKARDRLRLWRPVTARNKLDGNGNPTNLTEADLEAIAESIQQAWAPSTRETYGTGLYAFHLYCNEKGIPEEQRAPASGVLISSFAASLVGLYAGSTARNYILGVRAWHILHGVSWRINDAELEALLTAAEKTAPRTSRREKRNPFTVAYMVQLKAMLNMSDPLHAAVWACLTTVFWGAARLGEFTLTTLRSFDPALHIRPVDVRDEVDKQGRKLKVFRLPRTKSAVAGEDVSWSKQSNEADPEAAWDNHIRVNAPPDDVPLFAYRDDTARKTKHKALTKNKFLSVLKEAASQAKLSPLQGHGIRIGATLEYLLRGVPFEVMKVKGRWASDAFLTYLREHAQILAPYMQDNPDQNEEFLRLVMPPVVRR
ncbi:hypothetical protein CVT24_012975 [Panaeolus cyanescens]|uniref:Tyr recombinase domain-containing protein n=1 Tax=Panaeolus cyanescens TaxID=181874 RepID=A0A409YUK5_9AGAR|nr:hypothetical protein CVT24_012975 [Panaeolus cyanescens]